MHVVFVGVAAVGKTTLGREVAPGVGRAFADVDLRAEERAGLTIEAMLEEGWADGRINNLLWATFQELIAASEPLLVAASPRLLDRKAFWSLCRGRARTGPSALDTAEDSAPGAGTATGCSGA